MQGEAAAELTERCRSILMQTTHTTAQKQAMFKQREEHNLSKVVGRVCACTRVIAEAHRAEEIAIDRARRTIDLLRFAILVLDASNDKKVIGLQAEVPEGTRTTISIRTDQRSSHYIGSVVFYHLVLTDQFVTAMRNSGVFVVAELLEKKKSSEFEQVLLRAVHWLASAQAQFENENALLNLVTCLETFLKPAKDDPITATIAEGVAILTASGLQERKARKKRIKEFYAMRSTLTHEGRGAISLPDLNELRRIATDLTVQMIRRKDEFPDQAALRNWIDDQKLGSGDPPTTPV